MMCIKGGTMVSTLKRTGWAVCAGLALVFFAGGCMHHNVSRSQSGVCVDEDAFARIIPGKTSAAWACSIMGEPSSKQKTSTGSEILTWSGTEQKTVDAQFLIISDKSTTSVYHRASIEIRDGIVTDKWLSSREVKDQGNSGL